MGNHNAAPIDIEALDIRCDVAILGGGLTGCALALGLARSGFDVVVIERAPLKALLSDVFDGRVTAVARASKIFLDAIGAWDALGRHTQPILDIAVNEGYGLARVRYDHREVGNEPLGWIAENRHIRKALIEPLLDLPNCHWLAETSVLNVESCEASGVLTLEGGGRCQASLLALADGRHSRFRGKIGIESNTVSYNQSGIVATFQHEEPHHGVAIERFFPDGPFAMLPIQGNRSSIVWALETSMAKRMSELSDQDFTDEVQSRFGDDLGVLRLQGPRWVYPLSLVVAETYAADRAVLVGDCAHGIHPIAGQGWNLALRDVAVLCEILEDRGRVGLDIGDPATTDRYARWRRTDSAVLIAVTDGINRLFANDITPLKLAREAGLSLVEQFEPAKRLFMMHAMGMIGDMPASMKG